jgi:putative ABC transport system permease protein
MTETYNKPPSLLEKILSSILTASDKEALCGDFEEIHNDIVSQKGKIRARLWYLKQILFCLPRYIIHLLLWKAVILVKSLLFALRRLKRLQLTSTINIAGLAIGLAFFALLVAFVRDELTFDRFHEKSDQIYILTSEFRGRFMGGSHHFIAEMLESEFPEVGSTLRLARHSKLVRRENRTMVKDIVFSDPEFFDFFSFPLSAGDPAQALADPHRIVITASMAEAFFSGTDPLGKTLSVLLRGEYRDFIVSGIVDRIPGNSSLRFDCILSYLHVFNAFEIDPNNNDFVTLPMFTTTFLELSDKKTVESLKRKLPDFSDRLYGSMWRQVNMDPPKQGFSLLNLPDYHLGDVDINIFSGHSRPVFSVILSGIALLVLILACFNSVNLSLAHSFNRFKEIGIRKVIGARKEQLIGQLLTESLLSGCLSLILGIVLASLLISPLSSLTGKSLTLSALLHPQTLLVVILAVLVVSLFTGISPALWLSRFPVAEIFRARFNFRQKGALSQTLIVFQFAVSIFLLIGTLVMVRQLQFLSAADLGYKPEGIFIVHTQAHPERPEEGESLLQIFRTELRSDPHVLAVSGDSGTVGSHYGGMVRRYDKEGIEYEVESYLIDPHYRETLEIPLVGGRDLSSERSIDALDGVLINEAFVREFGLADPIGRHFSDFAVDKLPPEYTSDPVIVGVVRDFHLRSLHFPITPMVFGLRRFPVIQRYINILVKVRPGEEAAVLEKLEGIWKKLRPELPFSGIFLEDVLNREYSRERSWGQIVGCSAGFALFIACMGLFGLTAVNEARRTKETGIRKVLGASPADVLFLFSRDLLKWVTAANLLAWPIAFIAAREWLKGFAYRVDIGIWGFVAAGVLSFLIAGLAMSWYILKAIFSDPVRSLRYE